ncbi:MAG TPA: repressor LexA, partial [Planctomycetaceae bacterium]|nr:repressor LexA [Planctomycetaceae bacterium]
MNRPLTKQQQSVYDFIRERIADRGYGPTVREIAKHMEIRNPNGVMCHLRALEKKGMITRAANKSRAIKLTEPQSKVAGGSLPIAGSVLGGSCLPITNPSHPPYDLSGLASVGSSVYRVLDDSLVEVHVMAG